MQLSPINPSALCYVDNNTDQPRDWFLNCPSEDTMLHMAGDFSSVQDKVTLLQCFGCWKDDGVGQNVGPLEAGKGISAKEFLSSSGR